MQAHPDEEEAGGEEDAYNVDRGRIAAAVIGKPRQRMARREGGRDRHREKQVKRTGFRAGRRCARFGRHVGASCPKSRHAKEQAARRCVASTCSVRD